MTQLLTAAQMKAVEAAAIASGRVTGLGLMERAGRGVVEAIFAEWPELAAGSFRAVVLCGPGGNGGDGYVVARLLKEWGWEVLLHPIAPPAAKDAKVMASLWTGPLRERLEWGDFQGAALVVDAMFGIGLQRDISGGVWGLLEMAKTSGCKLVAVDILSGICADSGRKRARDYLKWPADLTVTFQTAKPGHYLAEGAALRGALAVVPLDLAQEVAALSRGDLSMAELAAPMAAGLRKVSGHKFNHGHALVLAGAKGGAARLAARGALRIGAGGVTVGCPPEAMVENAGRLDAVMLRPVSDGGALAQILSDPRINALCIGPGFGTGSREADVLAQVLGRAPPPAPPHKGEGRDLGHAVAPKDEVLSLPLVGRGEGWGAVGRAARRSAVLDADALTILSQRPDLVAALHGACVLTPHAGEFARLFPDIAAKLAEPPTSGPAYSKLDATREAAVRAGCVVLYKGADTVIAGPDGRCEINSAAYERSAPWLATAGSGDVLAGFITGLLARGFQPFEAACTAAWLHVECARSFGPGLIAEDLPEELPKVFRQFGV